jgi:hypothetical protein
LIVLPIKCFFSWRIFMQELFAILLLLRQRMQGDDLNHLPLLLSRKTKSWPAYLPQWFRTSKLRKGVFFVESNLLRHHSSLVLKNKRIGIKWLFIRYPSPNFSGHVSLFILQILYQILLPSTLKNFAVQKKNLD